MAHQLRLGEIIDELRSNDYVTGDNIITFTKIVNKEKFNVLIRDNIVSNQLGYDSIRSIHYALTSKGILVLVNDQIDNGFVITPETIIIQFIKT